MDKSTELKEIAETLGEIAVRLHSLSVDMGDSFGYKCAGCKLGMPLNFYWYEITEPNGTVHKPFCAPCISKHPMPVNGKLGGPFSQPVL
jgi:hypothetical protein